MFIGLNPSTADETTDDATIRRCVGFAKAWGYSALCMTNLFAFRATDPAVMKAHDEDWDSRCENLNVIQRLASQAGVVIAAWGVHGVHLDRDQLVSGMLGGNLHCLGRSKDGHPRHPLYLKADSKPMPLNKVISESHEI